jgi:hypothetical protein
MDSFKKALGVCATLVFTILPVFIAGVEILLLYSDSD